MWPGRPHEVQLLSYLKDSVTAFGFLTKEYRNISRASPYRRDAFPGGSIPNLIPKVPTDFVRSEVAAPVKRGYLVNGQIFEVRPAQCDLSWCCHFPSRLRSHG